METAYWVEIRLETLLDFPFVDLKCHFPIEQRRLDLGPAFSARGRPARILGPQGALLLSKKGREATMTSPFFSK